MKAKHIFLLRQLGVVKWFLLFYLVISLPLSAYGQERYCCTPNMTRATRTRGFLDYPNTDWDPNRIYRQPVILITFKDCNFSMPDPVNYYWHLLNEPGYNEGVGLGCVADYFRDQSEGLFNIQFDIYGPIKVDTIATGNGAINYGGYAIKMATKAVAKMGIDFSPYDWNGDGQVNQMVYIAAGFCGNQVKEGYIWPNTGDMSPAVRMPGNVVANFASISCEMWQDGTSCGIGTICHEFTHCLGLPDIYPTIRQAGFSVVDEWDLMDGGNYTNKGWCPPNYSALEKMLLGWKTPVELTDEADISGMKPVSEGGETYIIRNPGHKDEFYLIENRQQNGWDYASPGSGMLIFHVDYDREVWSNNRVNASKTHYRYNLFNADGKNYNDWDPGGNGYDFGKYTMANWMRNRYLSTSTFPYRDDSLIVDQFTDDSNPAATLFNENTDGSKFMSKPITGIHMNADGTISFSFNTHTAIARPSADVRPKPVAYYDLNGRRLPSAPSGSGIYLLRYTDGTTRKVVR